jgi:hypothetical protein
MAKSSSPFSFLWQALLLPSKNPKLFSNVFLIYIISHVLLYIGLQLSITPLISKLNEYAKLLPTVDPSNPEFTELVNTIKAVTKQLLIDEVFYFVILFVVSCFLSIIVYYANSATYVGEMLTLKELLNKVKGIIKGPIITQLFAVLFCFIYLVIFGVIVAGISFYVSINNYKSNLLFIMIPVILLATLILVYIAIIWSMGVAISVIEPNIYGISAISHAAKLLKGKKMQMFLLTLVSCIISGVIYVGNTIITRFVSESKAVTLVLGLLYQLLQQVVALYSMMAITVLYYECSQNNGGTGNEVEYSKLATTSIV